MKRRTWPNGTPRVSSARERALWQDGWKDGFEEGKKRGKRNAMRAAKRLTPRRRRGVP